MKKNKVIWTKEKVFEESKKYNTKCEFREKSITAYYVSYKNGWLIEMNWLKSSKKTNGYWHIKENVIEESKKYNSRFDFQRGCVSAYQSARKNGWLDEMTWLIRKDNHYNSHNYVYAYIDYENNVVYIGRTCNLKNRHSQHLNPKNKSSVWFYFNSVGKEIPKPLCLEENLSLSQSQIKEDEWKNKYVELGYKALNKGKTGLGSGSVGTLALKWNKNRVFEESKKYTKRSEFAIKSSGAYIHALKNGWLDEMTWLVSQNAPKGYWTKDRVFEESRKYKTRTDFEKGKQRAYQIARINKWLDEMIWLQPKHKKIYWTKEKVFNEALKYVNSYEFSLKCSGAYHSAKKNGWTKELQYKNDF